MGDPDEPMPAPLPRASLARRVWHRFTHLLDDREPGEYSSIAPRDADGTRKTIFFFNGSGRGR